MVAPCAAGAVQESPTQPLPTLLTVGVATLPGGGAVERANTEAAHDVWLDSGNRTMLAACALPEPVPASTPTTRAPATMAPSRLVPDCGSATTTPLGRS